MEWTRGLNCSSQFSGFCDGDVVDPRKMWDKTVAANQQLLNIVKERETRATAAAALFRGRHFALLRELAAAEAEVAALNARSRDLVAALREAQLHGAGQAQHIDNTHAMGNVRTHPAAADDDNAAAEGEYAQLLQRLTHTGRLREELQVEVRQLQSTCEAALQERAVLMQSLKAQEEALEPLLRDADDLARGVAEVRETLRTYAGDAAGAGRGTRQGQAALLEGVVAWAREEERAVQRVTALLSDFIGVEDKSLKTATSGRLRSVDGAVRFYQTWNDALARASGDFAREMNGRRAGLYARVEELQRFKAHNSQLEPNA
ncbi:hypothetical protein TraAM80_08874 [Trypanosoma rangeli]|uniref:Uncharacterized protein n=1 Tax=Trypanosoma rangeli TaxID=5698 RepID=A0A3R7LJ52_TRYRA|nr:uncharacterized protein TraAM80_08874 [Trypanosoma rangeli]RNE98267.1 hypothetical protein TraAM80_08874 [Trypanosoma rangeli]|eukprot:RNE98267.1 hypothetical protein TraAM80_08874 [Trypanosoma rangeli]